MKNYCLKVMTVLNMDSFQKKSQYQIGLGANMRRTLAYHQIGNRYYLLYQIWKCVVVYHLKEIKLSIITCYHPVKRLRATYRYFHKEKRE